MIDIYIEPSDFITHDTSSNFVNKKFCQYVTSMAIATKSVLIEAYWSIKIVEKYDVILQMVYKVIINDLQGYGLNKKIIL